MADFEFSVAIDSASAAGMRRQITDAFREVNISVSRQSLNKINADILTHVKPKLQLDFNKSSAIQMRKRISEVVGAIPLKLDFSSTQLRGVSRVFKELNAEATKLRNTINDVGQSIGNVRSGVAGGGSGGRRGPRVAAGGGSDESITRQQALESQIKKTNKTIKEQTEQTNKASHEISSFGERLGFTTNRLLAYSIAASTLFQVFRGVRFAAQEIITLDREINKLTQILDGNSAAASKTAGEILDLAQRYGVAGEEILKTTNTIAQAGFRFQTPESLIRTVDALSKTTLAASFGSIKETTDGLIAVLGQFNLTADETNRILDVTNKLSQDFGAEASDIFNAVKRAGAGFSAAGGSFEELASVATAAREITRLSGESIGTAIQSLSVRANRQGVIDFQEDLTRTVGGIRDANGELLSLTERLKRVALATKGFSPERLNQVIERIGDIRNSKVLVPLLQDLAKGVDSVTQKALDAAQKDAFGSLSKSAEIGIQSIGAQLQTIGPAFDKAFKAIGEQEGLRELVKTFVDLSKSLAGVLETAAPLVPLLLKLSILRGGIALARSAKDIGGGFFSNQSIGGSLLGTTPFSSSSPISGSIIGGSLLGGRSKIQTQRVGEAAVQSIAAPSFLDPAALANAVRNRPRTKAIQDQIVRAAVRSIVPERVTPQGNELPIRSQIEVQNVLTRQSGRTLANISGILPTSTEFAGINAFAAQQQRMNVREYFGGFLANARPAEYQLGAMPTSRIFPNTILPSAGLGFSSARDSLTPFAGVNASRLKQTQDAFVSLSDGIIPFADEVKKLKVVSTQNVPIVPSPTTPFGVNPVGFTRSSLPTRISGTSIQAILNTGNIRAGLTPGNVNDIKSRTSGLQTQLFDVVGEEQNLLKERKNLRSKISESAKNLANGKITQDQHRENLAKYNKALDTSTQTLKKLDAARITTARLLSQPTQSTQEFADSSGSVADLRKRRLERVAFGRSAQRLGQRFGASARSLAPGAASIGVPLLLDSISSGFDRNNRLESVIDDSGNIRRDSRDIIARNGRNSTISGSLSGASSGALIGGQVGLAGGPIGVAIGLLGGTIVGAIIGGFDKVAKAQSEARLEAVKNAGNVDFGKIGENLSLFLDASKQRLDDISNERLEQFRSGNRDSGVTTPALRANDLLDLLKNNIQEGKQIFPNVQNEIKRLIEVNPNLGVGGIRENIRNSISKQISDAIKSDNKNSNFSNLDINTVTQGIIETVLTDEFNKEISVMIDASRNSSKALDNLSKELLRTKEGLTVFVNNFENFIDSINQNNQRSAILRQGRVQGIGSLTGGLNEFSTPQGLSNQISREVLGFVRINGFTSVENNRQLIGGTLGGRLNSNQINGLSAVATAQVFTERLSNKLAETIGSSPFTKDESIPVTNVAEKLIGEAFKEISPNANDFEKELFGRLKQQFQELAEKSPDQFRNNGRELAKQLLGNADLGQLIEQFLQGSFGQLENKINDVIVSYNEFIGIQKQINGLQSQTLQIRSKRALEPSLGASDKEVFSSLSSFISQNPFGNAGDRVTSASEEIKKIREEIRSGGFFDSNGSIRTNLNDQEATRFGQLQGQLIEQQEIFTQALQDSNQAIDLFRNRIDVAGRRISEIIGSQSNLAGKSPEDLSNLRFRVGQFSNISGGVLQGLGIQNIGQLNRLSGDQIDQATSSAAGFINNPFISEILDAASQIGGATKDQAELFRFFLGRATSQSLGLPTESPGELKELLDSQGSDFEKLRDIESQQLTGLGNIERSLIDIAKILIDSNPNLPNRNERLANLGKGQIPTNVPNNQTPQPFQQPSPTQPISVPRVNGLTRQQQLLLSNEYYERESKRQKQEKESNNEPAKSQALTENTMATLKLSEILNKFTESRKSGKSESEIKLDANVVLTGLEEAGKDIRAKGLMVGLMEQLIKNLDRSNQSEDDLARKIELTIKQFKL